MAGEKIKIQLLAEAGTLSELTALFDLYDQSAVVSRLFSRFLSDWFLNRFHLFFLLSLSQASKIS